MINSRRAPFRVGLCHAINGPVQNYFNFSVFWFVFERNRLQNFLENNNFSLAVWLAVIFQSS